MSERRKFWGTSFRPKETFKFGWKRFITSGAIMDTFSLGPWEFTRYVINESLMEGTD